jgi:hypothetical protein
MEARRGNNLELSELPFSRADLYSRSPVVVNAEIAPKLLQSYFGLRERNPDGQLVSDCGCEGRVCDSIDCLVAMADRLVEPRARGD